MKCKICENFFVSETKFHNIFRFDEVCSECFIIDNAETKIEIIPIEYGLIEYLYLYDDLLLNYKQKEYLKKNFKTLFKELLKKEDKKVVIIIDDFIYENLEKELRYIIGFKQIIFMSVYRYEFESFVSFY